MNFQKFGDIDLDLGIINRINGLTEVNELKARRGFQSVISNHDLQERVLGGDSYDGTSIGVFGLY